jgi:hypothetical protein
MSTSRPRKSKARTVARAAPDPKVQLLKLRARLEKERACLDRWQKRLLRAFHAFERLTRLVARLERRISKLEGESGLR